MTPVACTFCGSYDHPEGACLLRQRVQKRMADDGIPVGTDDPELLALGAKPLPVADTPTPRILTLADRATIRERYEHTWPADDVNALLDTCDAMENVIRRLLDGDRPENGQWLAGLCWDDDRGPVSPAGAAVLDTIREDHTDG